MFVLKNYFKKTIAFILILSFVFTNALPCFATDLVYSELSYIPSNSNSFNCYGYAIGTNENVDPGAYCNSSTGSSAEAIRQLVIRDLSALGYTNVRSVTKDYVLRSGERMVAFAYGFWYQINNLSLNGASNEIMPRGEGYLYHFWKKDVHGGYWYHKYGQTSAIMRLKNKLSPEDIEVTDEYYSNSGNISPAMNILNNATIYYIAFETNTSVNSIDTNKIA